MALCAASLAQEGRAGVGLGALLWTFLQRYGGAFDYESHAVAVGRGGIRPAAQLAAAAMQPGRGLRVCVQDPHTLRCAKAYALVDVPTTIRLACKEMEVSFGCVIMCKGSPPSASRW
jgi:hypothetical protein